MAIKKINDAVFTQIANAIRGKNGASTQYYPGDMAQAISDIPTGAVVRVTPKDVNYYDYDGTLLYSYTAAEFANLTDHPANPTRQGLTAHGWNWQLSTAKTFVNNYGRLVIGQNYITDDNKTRIYVEINEHILSPYLGLCVNGSVTIDWGDSQTDTVTGSDTTTAILTQHTYSAAGAYVIKITPASGASFAVATGTLSSAPISCLLIGENTTTISKVSQAYLSAVKAIEIGDKVVLSQACFCNLYNLKTITIPGSFYYIDSPRNIPENAFQNCKSLKAVITPMRCNSIKTHAFDGCSSLKVVSLVSYPTLATYAFQNCGVEEICQDGTLFENLCTGCSDLIHITPLTSMVFSIPTSAFEGCESLCSMTIPSGIFTVYSKAFKDCGSLREIHMQKSTPPTLWNSDAFDGIPGLTIYVPQGSLSSYQSATNWSAYASIMQEEA